MGRFAKLKKGIHQPLVMGIQEVLGVDADGFFGINTENALKQWQEDNGLTPDGVFGLKSMAVMQDSIDVRYKIFHVIGEFEGAGFKQNGWGYISIVPGDNAGTNYGIMQVNKLGSYRTMVKQYGCTGPDWFGTPAGAKGQFAYFCDKILEVSKSIAKIIGDESPKSLLLLCDARVQGGGFYPSRPRPIPTWDDWAFSESEKEKIKKLFNDMDPKEAYLKAIQDSCCPARMFAELYPRYGVKKYLEDQLSRRRTAICGKGYVHGSYYSMSDYGL